jgi:APA family basic amino acid/polyamine antiporter
VLQIFERRIAMSIKAKLTTFDTTMIVVSLVIGIGIFRTPAIVARETGTTFLFLAAWVLGGFISLLGALTFAEIGSRFPHPGSFYKVVAASYGGTPAFMLNWTNVVIVNGAGVAAVAMIGAEYLNPIILPPHLRTPLAIQISAAGLVLVLLAVNALGIKTGARAQNVLTGLKIGMMALIVFAAVRHSGGPAAVATTGALAAVPAKSWGLALAAGLISVFYTYGGYHHTINFGADVRNARRNMPRAIVAGIAIILACYLAINLAYVKVLGTPGIAGAKLVAAETAKVVFGDAGYLIVSLVIVLSALGFLNVTLMHMPRIYYAMAEDGALPAVFKRVHPKTQAQGFGLLFLGAMILAAIFFLGTFESIINYVMFLDCLNIALAASTIFVLRRRARTETPPFDGFKAPLFPVLPAFFILFLLGISANILLTQTREALLGAVFFATGWPVLLLMRKMTAKKEIRS